MAYKDLREFILSTGAMDGSVDEAEAAVRIARKLLLRSQELQTPQEFRQQAELDRMIQHPDDRATLVQWTDEAFRAQSSPRVADQLIHILDIQGVPRFFSAWDKTLLRGFQSFGSYLPGVAVPLVKRKMRDETANVILPAETQLLSEHLRKRQQDGIRMNVNLLGETVLGEEEARHRLEKYIDALGNKDIECVSVKISTLYSQLSALSAKHSCKIVSERLERLYRTALANQFKKNDGSLTTKFVYLDMEEYRDLRLTAEVLKQTLDHPGLEMVRAGIALQAYLPDSYTILEELSSWATERVRQGKSPLTIRVVKGANLEMERVDAAIHGWPQAPYVSKLETDANYKRMLKRLLQPDLADSIRIGVASHNLFDIALAMIWAVQNNAMDQVQFEMLEGMANHQRRAVVEAARSMLLYAPACRQEDFLNAIGYLIRRLDENTGPANFLRHTFRLSPDSQDWKELSKDFIRSYEAIDSVSSVPRRTQNRNLPPVQPREAGAWQDYINEPDTDWTLTENVKWAEMLVQSRSGRCDESATEVPLVIDGEERYAEDQAVDSFDPSRPGVVASRYTSASLKDVESAAKCAQRDESGWRRMSLEDRHRVLRDAAQRMRARRADLIGAAMADGGKTISEADAEVSEAIDFTEFYPLTVKPFENAIGIGTVVVVSPWNFPIAIPCGGIAASLAAGNCVILKPSSETVLPAYVLCQCFWEAGVSKQALQFLPCSKIEVASALVNHEAVDRVILTGGTETARSMLKANPRIGLIAETGGKNATIVTALSDHEQAIKNVVHSAFSHSGQKCSATSLLLLEEEVFEEKKFREMLADATRSLVVGPAWDLSTRVGPLIRPPRGDLLRGMTQLDGGESWLVAPEQVVGNPNLHRPCIKWNVAPGSFTHKSELFGPVLAVMPFRKLNDAIAVVNATGYGLTSGLESLDDREQTRWKQSIHAGNLYINRGTTGAIVLRQPFGGVGKSSYGPGFKAGGPNYVVPLMKHAKRNDELQKSPSADTSPVIRALLNKYEMYAKAHLSLEENERLLKMLRSMEVAFDTQFASATDTVRLLGQDNIRRYSPIPHLRIRLRKDDSLTDCLIAAAAALISGCRAVFSCKEMDDPLVVMLDRATDSWAGRVEIVEESDEELANALCDHRVDRLRFLCEMNEITPEDLASEVREACIEQFIPILYEPVVENGYVELLWYLQEQSISFDYHRYGNLGRRSNEKRRT